MTRELIKKILFIIFYAILVLLIFLLLTYFSFEERFKNRIYPNVYFSGLNLSNLTRDEAQILVENKVNDFEDDGIKITLNNKEIYWYNLKASFDPDLASIPVIYNISNVSSQAYLVARDGTWLEIFNKIKSLFSRTDLKLEFSLDEDEICKIIKENFSELETPVKESGLIFKEEVVAGIKKIVFSTQTGSSGYEIDYELFLSNLRSRIEILNNEDISLKIIEKKPKIEISSISDLPLQAEELLKLAPFELISNEKKSSFKIETLEFASWIEVKEDLSLGLNEKVLGEFFDKNIAPEVNQEALQPRIELRGERVSIFEPGRNGLALDYEASILAIEEALKNKDISNISLVVKVEEIEKINSSKQSNELGIFELIGSGHSNFAGSSYNRRHNIKVGANRLHGLIIKPGEEFSLVAVLGAVDGSTGYLQELVIKDNRTIPEYGGGLCQIATTIFRTALGAGLPITERRNHSYRVSYYEPAGTDATVYLPKPDFKFKNDTGNNILIQARFEGTNDMYFDLWGKSDGRVATTSAPVIYNIIKPGPTKIIETTDLKPGEKKCTERAHNGADTYFDYSVVYNYGQESENKVDVRFSSKYVPWREVCLLGVEKPEEIATSTEDTLIENTSSSSEDIDW